MAVDIDPTQTYLYTFEDANTQAPAILLDDLPGALSALGETLESRFELEDLLIRSIQADRAALAS